MDTVQVSIWVVGTLVFVALLFDFMNGFHDAANSIATIVSTRVLKPQQAVVWAAAFNFLAYFLFQLKVASTIGKGTIDPAIVDYYVVFGALIGAIIWNVITWYYGIPSSSSHALVGGLVGAAVANARRHVDFRQESAARHIDFLTGFAERMPARQHVRAFQHRGLCCLFQRNVLRRCRWLRRGNCPREQRGHGHRPARTALRRGHRPSPEPAGAS